MKKSSLLSLVLVLSLSASAAIVTYPEYPAAIPRDYAYAVRVTQGKAHKPLTVYNRTEKSQLIGRTRGGDVNRRFCEFAFDGEPVTVEFRVTEDVKSYAVFPSRLNLPHTFKDGVIKVTVAKPCRFGLRLNDYDKSILSVFAESPEPKAEIPKKGASGVMYVDGWVDAPGRDGALETGDDVKEIYLAPGSVLNARLVVKGKGTFVHGRGMILDPLSDIFRFDQTKNTRRGLLTVGASDVRVKDVKLIDARTFNFMSWFENVRFENVKALAAMMCTDGITLGGRGFVCEGAWLYVGDNALVLSGGKDFTISDVAIGTSCAAIFPQSSPEGRLKNIDIFRTDDGFLNNMYNGVLRRNNKWNEMNGGLQKKEPGPQDLVHQTCDLTFEDCSLADCTRLTHLFRGRNMGTKLKKYVFKNLVGPMPESGKTVVVDNDPAKWLITDNYDITFVGGSYDEKSAVKPKPSREEVNWTCPYKVTRNGALVRDWRKIDPARKPRELEALKPGTNLVREIWPRQSVWQRVPSWLVKMETENGTDEMNRIYKLIQCEKGGGMLSIVTDEALSLGKGRYRLSFEASAELGDSSYPIELNCRVRSNDWAREEKVSVGEDWAALTVAFDLPIERENDDLVALSVISTRPADTLRFRNVSFTKVD